MISRDSILPRPRASRLFWTIAAAGSVAVAASGALLFGALSASHQQTYSFCVNDEGKVRLLSGALVDVEPTLPPGPPDDDDDDDQDDDQGDGRGRSDNSCRRHERRIEVPTDERVAGIEATVAGLGASMADVLATLALAGADIGDLLAAAEAMGISLADLIVAVAAVEIGVGEALARAASLEAGLAGAGLEIGALQNAVADLDNRLSAIEQPPTPTPTPTPMPTPTPTPFPTPTPTPTGAPSLLQQVLAILGPTGVILPLSGDAPSSFTSVGAVEAVFTWSQPLDSFDTPGSTQGVVPVVTFNGTDEEADTPDAAFWSVDDSGDNGFSIGGWVRLAAGGTGRVLLSKYHIGNGREYFFNFDSGNVPTLLLRDESQASAFRAADAGISTGVWHHVVITYDGTGGATAANGITIYVDGATVSSAANNNASYVGMENGTGAVTLGFANGGGGASPNFFFEGDIAGGPLGPWFITHDAAGIVTADEVLALYNLGMTALGL